MNLKPIIASNFIPGIFFLMAGAMCVLGLTSFSGNSATLVEWHIISINNTPLVANFIIDPTRLFYSSIVLFISANVITFSKHYIKDDPFINRFTVLVVLFVVAINLLIFIPHFMMLLLG
jgi:NADH:ubiquinone oxidoreductase subunit 5 (subunit L)/multisubunit Na+/H+ antiporter MnhA subunit